MTEIRMLIDRMPEGRNPASPIVNFRGVNFSDGSMEAKVLSLEDKPEANAGCLGRIPISRGRDIGYTQINDTSWVYGVIVGKALLDYDRHPEGFEPRFLEAWTEYQRWLRGQSVADVLGLDRKSKLHRLPSWSVVMPWFERSPSEVKKWLPRRVVHNRQKHGYRFTVGMSGKKIMNRDSLEAGPSHSRQFRGLIESFLEHGFMDQCNSNDPFKVWILESESDWHWMLVSGTHRLTTAVAMGLEYVHAELEGTICREDVETWPGVVKGDFSVTEALHVFDSLTRASMQSNTKLMLDSLGRL